ncbi:hypothetical protein V493_01611 [Pseudogymnoascus sp. VKM F-4281 (FW-2241)]|nr:hypothetical protein V493_01611 [Pseudogymnoascus sp. VKM F-4281 (FW-2241)]
MESSQLQVFPWTSHPASKSIPLDKYSSAVSSEGSRSHRWVHDVRKDLLTLTFKPVDTLIDYGRSETHLLMTVTAGRDTLEHLDVQKLVRWSQEHNEHLHRGLVSSSVESPVQVIVRFPCIAMRFPGAPSMVKRFQLRFKDNKQYLEALNILKRAGLPVKEAQSETKQYAPSQDRNVAYNRSLTSTTTQPFPVDHSDNHQRPQFAIPSSRRFTQFTDSSLIPARSDTSSSLSMRPSSTFSTDPVCQRPSSSLGTSYKDGIHSDEFYFQPPPPRPFSSASSTRPSSPIYASQIETQQRATLTQGPWIDIPSDMDKQRKEQSCISAPCLPLSSKGVPKTGCGSIEKSPQLPKIRQPPRDSTETLAAQQPLDDLNIKRSATATQFTPGLKWGCNNEHLQSGRQSSLSFSTTRPMSAPTVGDDLHASQWIPPKRELPFPKRKESKRASETAQKHKKVSENSHILQSEDTGASKSLANTATFSNKHGEQGGKRVAAQRTNTPPTSRLSSVLEVPDSDETRSTNALRTSVVRQEEPSPLASKSAAIPRPSTAPILNSKAISSRKRSNEAAPEWALAKRVKMISSSTQTQTLSGRDHTAALSRASTITAEPVLPATVAVPAPCPSIQGPSVPVPVPAPAAPAPNVVSEVKGLPEGFTDELGRFVSSCSNKRKPAELWEVSGWDRATEGERHSMTEAWICEQIEGPLFQELCKHIDNVWKEIGFKT